MALHSQAARSRHPLCFLSSAIAFMNTVRLQNIPGFAALPWRQLTILATVGIIIGLALAMTIPLPVS